MATKNGSTQYLFENKEEGKRQRNNRKAELLLEHLKNTGILSLVESPTLIDAGSGSGFISEAVIGMLNNDNKSFRLLQLDISKERLSEAKQNLAKQEQKCSAFIQTNLESIALASNCADYIFSMFVFEFLSNPQKCFLELLRILKPGGKLVIMDLDYNCLTHYPISERLELQLNEIAKILFQLKLLDANIGRKIYSFFYINGLKDIKVRLSAHHLFYGNLSSRDDYNWSAKFSLLEKLQEKGKIIASFSIKDFSNEFLEFLRSPNRFSYTPCLLVEGIK